MPVHSVQPGSQRGRLFGTDLALREKVMHNIQRIKDLKTWGNEEAADKDIPRAALAVHARCGR